MVVLHHKLQKGKANTHNKEETLINDLCDLICPLFLIHLKIRVLVVLGYTARSHQPEQTRLSKQTKRPGLNAPLRSTCALCFFDMNTSIPAIRKPKNAFLSFYCHICSNLEGRQQRRTNEKSRVPVSRLPSRSGCWALVLTLLS